MYTKMFIYQLELCFFLSVFKIAIASCCRLFMEKVFKKCHGKRCTSSKMTSQFLLQGGWMMERIRWGEGKDGWAKRYHVQRFLTLWQIMVTRVDSNLKNIFLLNAVFFCWSAYHPQECLTQAFHESRMQFGPSQGPNCKCNSLIAALS